ncbi:hypothetical protein Glove_420g60 [Diversispora epigaea]|uniref:Kaptin n=1 Tax=Diversispora epigaea TaxID=1348612 RepID=A0A397GWW7_9GLOM|nr:hypothetical protein Glove_420g60 [Diversispora epigaea]
MSSGIIFRSSVKCAFYLCNSSNMKMQFTESHFFRFSTGGRTNIYGLSVFETKMESGGLPINSGFPSNIIKSLPPYEDFMKRKNERDDDDNAKIYKHLFVSSFYGITCFIAATGHWSTVELPLDKEIGEIISIHAFPSSRSDLVLSLTTVQSSPKSADEEPQHQFTLRVYSLGDNTSIMSMEEAIFRTVAKHQSISLSFVPMQLYHAKIKINGESKVGLLLSGTDGGIHLYLENNNKDDPIRWIEESVRPYFPSLLSLLDSNSNISILEIQEINDLKIIAAGCQNGILFISILKLDIETNEYVQLEEPYSVALFSPITSITIFSSFTSEVDPSDIHLLVTCAVEQAIVYCNIIKNLLSYPIYLIECTKYDSVLCSHVLDVDWDGRNEIIIGTYGREMLIFKQDINEDPNSTISFKLIHQQSFIHPIYGIKGIYLNQDGINELIVATQYGVHILQPNLDKAKEVLVKRLKNLERLRQEYHHLESIVVNNNNNNNNNNVN